MISAIIIPILRNVIYVLPCAFAVQTSIVGSITVLSRATSSEAAGGVVLGDKLGLLVSHLFHCLHIIPLEYISLCHLIRAGSTPTSSHRHL